MFQHADYLTPITSAILQSFACQCPKPEQNTAEKAGILSMFGAKTP
jgi:hypothetical protein